MIKHLLQLYKLKSILLVSAVLFPATHALAGNFANVTWNSPIQDGVDTVEEVIMIILNALIVIAIPIIVLMIIYSGFLYVTARGNAEQVKKATTSLTYAIIGGILVIGAVAITGIMAATIGEFTS